MPSFYSFGNKWSVKNNKTTVRNSLTSDINTVNIDQAVWDGSNNVTSVGTNGRPSYYGCYDMNGNVFEWNDLNQTSSIDRGIRGGFWGCCNRGPYALGSDDSNITYRAQERYGTFGLRIASLTNPDNLSNFVLVGDAGNSNETIPNRWRGPVTIGGVSYEYYINKFKVTNDEYALFLNSIASTDTYILFTNSRGIVRTGSSGSYVYSVKNNYGNKPFTNINWFTCARYCNWLHNGKPTGAQNSSTTEDGAYLLNGATTGNAIAKKAGAKYFLPTENEWYKAAYYKGGGTNRGYWRYATQSNEYPRAILADVNGNGTLRPTSFRPSNTVGSGITTETITDNIFNVGLSLNYEQVASSGVTRIVPITSSIPNLPPNFTLSNNIGKYNITTTSSVSGNIDIKFVLPTNISLSTFNNTKVFHTNSSGITSDVTVTSGPNAPNYSTRTKYGRVTGFSDFHLIPSTETVLNQVAPSSLVGSVGNGYVDLSWSMSNAIDIIDYNIKYSKDNGVSWIDYEHVPQIELSIRVSGLTNGSNYLFKVASISAEGLSELSASSSSLTPLSIVPSAPSNVVAVSALNSAHLTWDVPSDNGGSIITGYIVQYSSNSGSSWTSSNDPLYLFADDVSTTRSLIITNLSTIPYIFRVAAINSIGSGNYSSVSNSVTPSGAVISDSTTTTTTTTTAPTTTTAAPTTTTTTATPTTTTTAAPTTTTTTTAAPTTTTTTTTAAPAGAFTLSGAGTTGSNGCYSQAGVINGVPYYTNGYYFVYYYANNWYLSDSGGSPEVNNGTPPEYSSNSDPSVFPSSWDFVVFGQEPVPTVSNGCGTTTTTAAPTTTTTTAAPTTTTTTTTTAAPISSLAVVSGSTQGSGTSVSPYLVAADTTPSPIYQANTPGILTVSFTNIRTGNYVCGKSGCSTGRFNESVYFDRNNGNFYEQIRTNIDNTTTSTGFGGEAFLTNASRNTLTTISYPMHKGQKLRMSQHSVIPDGYPGADLTSAADNNRQLTNARISFAPMNNPSFSVSYVGTRGVIGNGTPSNPYVSSTNFSSSPNQRTHSFRANGDGIIALFGWRFDLASNVVPYSRSDYPNIYIGGSANSFTGSRALNKLDMFNFTESPYNSITRPISRFNLLKVTDGQIFSFAKISSDKSSSWTQEESVGTGFRPIFCCVPNSVSDLGIWLMNTRISILQTRWQPSNTWSGQGTQASPANMNFFTPSQNTDSTAGNMSNIYLTMDGTISFNYEITNGIPVSVIKTLAPGIHDAPNVGNVTLSTLSNSSGSVTLNVKAFNGINFLAGQTSSKSGTFMSVFKITNLVFTPS